MGLFSNNLNTNILIAIEYSITLLNSGYSRENILLNLSKKKISKISPFSKKAIRHINSGKPYDEALSDLYMNQQHKNLKKFISIFNSDKASDITSMLNDLSSQIIKEKQLTIDTMIDNLTSKMQKSMMIVAIPLMIFFIVLIESTLMVDAFIPRPELDYLVYGITILILMIVLTKMRYKE
jgi:hypothetical protein